MIRPSPERGDVVAYDFRRPSRISPGRQRSLEASHEQLAQALQRWVSGRLRASFEVHLETIGQQAYGDFVDALANPGATFLYGIRNMPGMMIAVYFDPRIAFLLVERLLGGGRVSDAPERALTALERVVIRIVTDRVTREVTEVWKDHMDLDLDFSRFESAPELVEMTGRDDDLLVTTLRVEVEEIKGIIQIGLPFPVLESFFSPTQSRRIHSPTRTATERASEKHHIESVVRTAHIVVSAQLPEARIPLGTLAGLKPGDLLQLTSAPTDPVDVRISGALRFRGRQGRLGPNLGIEITESVHVD